MRPIPMPIAPITAEDITVIKGYIKESIKEAADKEPTIQPYICSIALDWQSEDKHVIQRVSRFDISYIDGNFIAGEAVPPEQKEDRTLINQIFELSTAIVIADARGWLKAPVDELLRSIPEDYDSLFWTFALWRDCGALLTTVLANHDSFANNHWLNNYQFLLREKYEPFQDCRENDGIWQELRGHWDTKPSY